MRKTMEFKIIARKTQRGDWLVQEEWRGLSGEWRSGRQLDRFDDQGQAELYAESERQKSMAQQEAVKVAVIAQPHPDPVDPFNHPAFWMVEAKDNDRAEHAAIRGVLTPEQLAKPNWHREWGKTEVVVNEGYQSPYQFGRLLQQMVDHDRTIVFRYEPTRIYFAMAAGSGRVAYYDPSKRENIPAYAQNGEIDWFKACTE